MVELPETKPTNLPLPVISRLFKEGVAKIEKGDLGLSEDPRDRIAIVRAIYPIVKRRNQIRSHWTGPLELGEGYSRG